MHIFIKHLKQSIKNNNERNSFSTRKNSFQILRESDYEIVPNQPQSQDNPPPSSSGSQWVWTPNGWTNYGTSSWSWDYVNGQWISTIGTYGGATFYMNQNGEIFAQSQNWITPQSMDSPEGYQYSGDPSFAHELMLTTLQIGRPGVGIAPGSGQPGISVSQIAHWFAFDSIIEHILSGGDPFSIVSSDQINNGPGTPFSVTARNFGILVILEGLFEQAFLSGWRYELSSSANGGLLIRFYQMVGGIPTYLTTLGNSPLIAQLLHNASTISTQFSSAFANIRNILAGGGLSVLSSAELLNAFGGTAGLRALMNNLIAAGVPALAIAGLIASVAFSAYTIYSQTGHYTQENIDALLGSLFSVGFGGNSFQNLTQFLEAWEALFGTTAPSWFSSTSGIDWNSLPDWLREFLIRDVVPYIDQGSGSGSGTEPKPQLLPAYDILPGQPGWVPRTPTQEELNNMMNRFYREIQPANPGSMGGNP